MKIFNWENRIKEWSLKCIELLTDKEKAQLPSDILESMWLGYPGATEKQIVDTEARLGITLPSSYRQFLKVSNGLRFVSKYGFEFYSAEDIDWYATNNQDTIDSWIEAYQEGDPATDEEYFVYGEEQETACIRPEYLQTALEISSECYDDICLLNPQVVTSEGEWEAWIFGYKTPGAYRYRSFDEMMNIIFSGL